MEIDALAAAERGSPKLKYAQVERECRCCVIRFRLSIQQAWVTAWRKRGVMARISLALLMALLLEGAAAACSCVGPRGERQQREAARAMARDAVAIVEAIEI